MIEPTPCAPAGPWPSTNRLPVSSPPPGSMFGRSWTPWLWGLALVLLVGLGVARALHQRQKAQSDAQAAAARLQAPVMLTMERGDLVQAQVRTLVQAIPVSGTVRATQTAWLKAKVAGELQGLVLREGDPVQAGQVVARVDPTESDARVRQAQQQAAAAEAQLQIARRTWTNNQALVQQGFISNTALESSQASLDAAASNHRAALAALDLSRKTLDDTTVRSPIGGQVATRPVQNGERVAVDARILEVVSLEDLEVEVSIPSTDAGAVRVGQTATLSIEGLAMPVTAHVARINPSAQAGSRAVLAYLRLPRAEGVRHGLFVNGQIQTGTVEGVTLPASAIRNDRPQPYVQWLRPADSPSGNQAEVVHQAVKVVARGFISPAGDANGMGQNLPYVVVESIAAGALLTSAGAGFLPEKTLVQLPGR